MRLVDVHASTWTKALETTALIPGVACTSRTGMSVRELEIDAPICLPSRLVGAGRVDFSARGRRQSIGGNSEPLEVRAHAVRTTVSEGEVVFIRAPRIGSAHEIHPRVLERTQSQAVGHLL